MEVLPRKDYIGPLLAREFNEVDDPSDIGWDAT